MKAIILAAGFGSRMKPLTDNLPKAMLVVAGQTIIQRIINALLRYNISSICVVTGYRREVLESYLLLTFPNINFTFVFNEAYLKTNNIFSMHLAFEKFEIDEDILLIESDLVISEGVLGKIIHSEKKNVALVDRFRAGMDGTVVAVNNDLVTSIIPPHLQGIRFDFSDKYKTLNIYKFSRDFIQSSFRKLLSFYATTYNNNCYYELILGILVYMQHETIYACDVQGEKWFEVDDVNDLRLAEIIFDENNQVEALDNAFGGFWNIPIIDFTFIRNMYFPNYSMLSDIRYNLDSLIQNYSSTQKILNEKLAHFILVPEEKVCLLNGLSQLYPILSEIFRGKTVLMPRPTFGEYEKIFQNKIYYTDSGFTSLSDQISESDVLQADIVLFVNPNNPTGSFFKAQEVIEFSERYPKKIIIVDESFVEFTACPTVQDLCIGLTTSNILVLKSLSKSLGIPGVRLGYICSNNIDFIRNVNSRIPIWNSNSIAEYFLEIILKHRRSLSESISQTIQDRDSFIHDLSALQCVKRVYASGANFILIQLNFTVDELKVVRQRLLGNWKIYIKDATTKFQDGSTYVRLAVRLPHENKMLVEAFRAELNI